MPQYRYDIKQNTDDWLRLRLGAITASGLAPVFVKPKEDHHEYSKGGHSYIRTKINELVYGELKFFETEATSWGHDHEEEAARSYEQGMGIKTTEVGFVILTDGVACSPDRLVGEDGLLEIKCPFRSDVHKGYIKKGEAPKPYLFQLLHQLFVTQRLWVDFWSYDPRSEMKVFHKRYTMDSLLALLGLTLQEYSDRIYKTRYWIDTILNLTEDIFERHRKLELKKDTQEDNISNGGIVTEVWA